MTADMPASVRLGILSSARIAPSAVIRPAAVADDVDVVSVAARDPERAKEFAAEHGIPSTHASYQELLADDDIDAIYNPLPNGLHGRWTLAALAAGKHVLCEKPFTANAEEAQQVATAAEGGKLVVMEAFHYRYHPVTLRAREIVESGELGAIRRVEAAVCFPLFRRSDIRFDPALAGGAVMDAGCYAVHLARLLGLSDIAGEPKVVAAKAKLRSPAVDRAMSAELVFPGEYQARVRCSLWSAELRRQSARVIGERGQLRVFNPIAPHRFSRLSVQVGADRRVEHFPLRSSYAYQLDVFADAVLRGTPVPTGPADSVATMTLLDEIYRAAGLPLREPTP
ncbi:MAG: Gfo/Idh/MocA family protein [Sciscionella sp.]